MQRSGHSVEIQIYGDGEGSGILELIDEERSSHVWRERFQADGDACAEALRALGEEPLEFAVRSSTAPQH